MCQECLSEFKSDCRLCEYEKFYNNNQFNEWLFNQQHYTAIAHNMSSYDGVFILKYINSKANRRTATPEILLKGSKILSIKWQNVRIIDSLLFFNMSLDKLTKALNLETTKGFYPYKFYNKENYNYVGPWPAPHYFGIDKFNRVRLDEFNCWYKEVSNSTFNLQAETEKYCRNDVIILAKSIIIFRKLFINISKINDEGIDPFKENITIASACNKFYRRNILKPKQIAYIPEVGYNAEKNSSYKSLLWLEYLRKKYNIEIRDANNRGEFKIGPYFVDGYCEKTQTIYEFHGCYYHGHPSCFTEETLNTYLNKSMAALYSKHVKRINFLKEKSKNIIEIWECEYDILCKQEEFIRLTEFSNIYSPINPRDCLFGGRTNAVKLYHKCEENEKIKYIDFTSLYPYVQKRRTYPIGHPNIIRQFSNYNIENYFGIIKCCILPPKGLFLPVLPAKINNKLVFSLCNKCAYLKINNCNHDDSQRTISGTWISEEVKLALKYGYKITKLIEVWHFDNKSDLLFSQYVDTFIKAKTESSGYPHWVKSEDDKILYKKLYKEKENVDLQDIEYNPAMRSFAKICVNNQWGYLGMNSSKTLTKYIQNKKDWFSLVCDNRFSIKSFFINENFIQVHYKNLKAETCVNTSVTHAAFVTCYARIKLYEELSKLNKNVLYFDTDSIIYIARPGEYEPPLGDYLGDFTLEIDQGTYITEFVSAGPKNYGFKLNNNKTKIVVKGFTLDSDTDLKVNFESIKNLVLNDKENKIEVSQLKFSRNKESWNVFSEKINKLYGFVYDKRILLNNFSTLPYGF